MHRTTHVTRLSAAAVALLAAAAPAWAADSAPAPTEARALEEAIEPLVAEPSMPAVYAATDDAEQCIDPWLEEQEEAAPKKKRKASPWDKYARPVSNLNFNHPFMWNEFRTVFMNQRYPERTAFRGGDVQVYAGQLWVNLTDDLQLVADKAGWVDNNPDVGSHQAGFLDFALGLKARAYEDLENEFTVAGGVIFETHSGSESVLQGRQSEGIFDIFVSTAKTLGPVNLIGSVGLELPRDNTEDSRALHYHLHADYEVVKGLSPLIEVNGYTYLDNAHRNGAGPGTSNVEGFDITNFGSSNVDGSTVITVAAGFRWDFAESTSLGVTYERPVTSRRDLLKDRITLDVTFRF